MKLWVVAVGQRVPDWAQTAWDDYAMLAKVFYEFWLGV